MCTSGLIGVNVTHGACTFPPLPLHHMSTLLTPKVHSPYTACVLSSHLPSTPHIHLPFHWLPSLSSLQLIVFPFIPKYIGFRRTFFVTVMFFAATSALLPVSNLITGPLEPAATNCSTNGTDTCIRNFTISSGNNATVLSRNSTDLGGNFTNITGFGGNLIDLSGNGTENTTAPFCGQVYQKGTIHDDSVTRILPTIWLVLGLILIGNTVARWAQCACVASGITSRWCDFCTPINWLGHLLLGDHFSQCYECILRMYVCVKRVGTCCTQCCIFDCA